MGNEPLWCLVKTYMQLTSTKSQQPSNILNCRALPSMCVAQLTASAPVAFGNSSVRNTQELSEYEGNFFFFLKKSISVNFFKVVINFLVTLVHVFVAKNRLWYLWYYLQ